MNNTAICWLRRDLRLDDNHALYEALTSGYDVLPLFIFDRQILDELPSDDARVTFIYNTLTEIKSSLGTHGGDLLVYYGNPEEVWPQVIEDHNVSAVYLNHDYEP